MGNIRICWPQVLHFSVRLPVRNSDRRVAPILPGYARLLAFSLSIQSRSGFQAAWCQPNRVQRQNYSQILQLLQLLYLTNPQWLENGQ